MHDRQMGLCVLVHQEVSIPVYAVLDHLYPESSLVEADQQDGWVWLRFLVPCPDGWVKRQLEQLVSSASNALGMGWFTADGALCWYEGLLV
jgi:hypothetical protein